MSGTEGGGPDRPARHGAALGRALAKIAEAGRAASPEPLPPMCATCGLREGTMPNISAGTGIMALNCVLGIEKDAFACHHGMSDGEPTRLCAGYLAARAAPFEIVRAIMADLSTEIDGFAGPDTIRADFDAWWAGVDPERTMDWYALARLFEKREPAP